MTLRIGSLFSGYGGLDIAVQNVLGGEVAWYSEIDKHACQVLAAHHPGVPNLGDITTVDWATVPPVDILTGGYPCQPFSHAGQRKGTNDERHLWPHVRDALVALRPMVAVLENVDGHRSLGLDAVLGDLAALGMSARWLVVRAADAGAPHGRKRVFIVVTADADQQGLQGSSARPTDAGRSRARGVAADHRGELPAHADGGGRDQGVEQPGDQPQAHRAGAAAVPAGRGADVLRPDASAADTPGTTGGQRPSAHGEPAQPGELGGRDCGAAAHPDGDGHGRELHARGVGSLEGEAAGGAPERQRPRGVADAGGDLAAADAEGNEQREPADSLGQRPELGDGGDAGPVRVAVEWGRYAPAIRRWERVLGRPAPSPTIAGANGRPRLSPAFVEWMMGLPEGHVTGHGLKPAACLKMLGNGVVPQQAELALRMILADEVAA